jgi:hypothetical protein
MAKKSGGRKKWVMTAARKAYYASKKKGAKGTMASAQARAQATSYTKMRAARDKSIKKIVAKKLKHKVVGSGGSMASPFQQPKFKKNVVGGWTNKKRKK